MGEYDITDCVSFAETFEKNVGRDEIFPVIKEIIRAVKNLSDSFLCESDVVLKREYIYLDRNTKEVKLVGAPEVLDPSNTIINFLQEVFDNTEWKQEEKKTYLNALERVLTKEASFDTIIQTIDEILKEPVQYIQIKPPIYAEPPKPPVFVKVPEPPKPPVFAKVPEPPKAPEPPIYSQPQENRIDSDFDAEEGYGETTVLGISNQPMIYPVLIRIKNNEKAVINKQEFIIGKDPVRVDYCIFDNSAVSRVHAKILCKNGEFFVVDQHSTNHVYVNGMLIDTNTEVRLTHGSRVRLGDEDFEFRFQ